MNEENVIEVVSYFLDDNKEREDYITWCFENGHDLYDIKNNHIYVKAMNLIGEKLYFSEAELLLYNK